MSVLIWKVFQHLIWHEQIDDNFYPLKQTEHARSTEQMRKYINMERLCMQDFGTVMGTSPG